MSDLPRFQVPRKKVASSSPNGSGFELLPTHNPDDSSAPERPPSYSTSLAKSPRPSGRHVLPPRPLTLPTRPRFWAKHCVIPFVALCATIGVTIGGTFGILGRRDMDTRTCVQSSSFLAVNFGIASGLTFARAKLIDIAWDLGVGQGGRILMAWITYVVAMDALVKIMENGKVDYETYLALSFDMPSAWTGWIVLRSLLDCCGGRKEGGWRMGKRAKAVLGTLLVCLMWVLGFPTLSGAMTSYVSQTKAYLKMPDGELLNSTSELTWCAVVEDGSRIGLKDQELVLGSQVESLDPIKLGWLDGPLGSSSRFLNDFNSGFGCTNSSDSICNALFNYAWTYFIEPTVSEYPPNTTRRNLTVTDAMRQEVTSSEITINNNSYSLSAPALNILFAPCFRGQQIPPLTLDDITCQDAAGFIWGFSSTLLILFISCQAVWIIVMYSLWLDANVNSALLRHGRRVRGGLRSVADLAAAVQEDLGDGACTYGGAELSRAVKGKGVRFFADGEEREIGHIGVSSRREERVVLCGGKLYGGKGS